MVTVQKWGLGIPRVLSQANPGSLDPPRAGRNFQSGGRRNLSSWLRIGGQNAPGLVSHRWTGLDGSSRVHPRAQSPPAPAATALVHPIGALANVASFAKLRLG